MSEWIFEKLTLTAAYPIEGRFSRKWAALIIILLALVPAYIFGRIETAPPPVRYVQIEGYASAGSHGNAAGVVFVPNGSIPGYVNSMFFGQVVDGRYNVSLPDYHSYGYGAEYQTPGGVTGPCWSGNTVQVDQSPNSVMALNFTCTD